MKLEAFVKGASSSDQGGGWYSLGIYEKRERDGAGDYAACAEHWRKRAQQEYGRCVVLRPVHE